MIVRGVKRSCIIRSIHQNVGVVITGINYLLPLPDSANSDLCRHVKQKNGLIRIKAIQLAPKQDSG